MPLGLGFWYDRINRRFHRITEHATNAVGNPKRYRSQAVAHLNPIRDREAIVRHVSAKGYIRVRLYKSNLGFEFHGDPDSALAVLRRFLIRHEVGGMVQINISDFASGISIIVPASSVMASKAAAHLGICKPTGRRSHA